MQKRPTIRWGNEMTRKELEELLLRKEQLLVKQTDNLTHALESFALSAGLRWTKAKPVNEGWYWAERDMAGLPGVSMVFVTRIDRTYTHVWNPNERKEYGTADFDWWYGPLSYPYRLGIRDCVMEPGEQ